MSPRFERALARIDRAFPCHFEFIGAVLRQRAVGFCPLDPLVFGLHRHARAARLADGDRDCTYDHEKEDQKPKH